MKIQITPRGFERIEDPEGHRIVQQSSAIGDSSKPGSSYLWVGEVQLNRTEAAELAHRLLAWSHNGSLKLLGET